jgi:hypothetical protein
MNPAPFEALKRAEISTPHRHALIQPTAQEASSPRPPDLMNFFIGGNEADIDPKRSGTCRLDLLSDSALRDVPFTFSA